MEWTSTTPDKVGFYWCHQRKSTRMVHVGAYVLENKRVVFTNEDGGVGVDDEEWFGGSLWFGPIEPPPPPTDK